VGLGQTGTTGVPNRQGFDECFGFLDQHYAHNYYFPDYLWRGEQRVPLENVVGRDNIATRRVQYAPDLFTREAIEFLDRHRAGPFFLYLANDSTGRQQRAGPGHGQRDGGAERRSLFGGALAQTVAGPRRDDHAPRR
jgi:hypothetical protein